MITKEFRPFFVCFSVVVLYNDFLFFDKKQALPTDSACSYAPPEGAAHFFTATSMPSSSGRNLGQTFSDRLSTEEARVVPISTASFRLFP